MFRFLQKVGFNLSHTQDQDNEKTESVTAETKPVGEAEQGSPQDVSPQENIREASPQSEGGGPALEENSAHDKELAESRASGAENLEKMPSAPTASAQDELIVREKSVEAPAAQSSVPPIEYMVAFLQATLRSRRTAMRSLQGMSRRCQDERVKELADYMVHKLGQSYIINDPRLFEVADTMGAKGKKVSINTLAAFTILADLYLENLDKPKLDETVLRHRRLTFSLPAVNAAARFLGGETAFPADENADRALEFLRTSLARRTVRDILQDLSEDGGSPVSCALVKQLTDVICDDANLLCSEQKALCDYMQAAGVRVNPDTISAVCLFTDFESGAIKSSDLQNLRNAVFTVQHSVYALQATARSFGVNLRCLYLKEDDNQDLLGSDSEDAELLSREDKIWSDLEHLHELSQFGLIVRMSQSDGSRSHTVFISEKEQLRTLRESGERLDGEVLLEFCTLDDVPEDVVCRLLKSAGKSVLARYISHDRVVCWRTLTPADSLENLPQSVAGSIGFIDGFRAYRFSGVLAARCVEQEARRLVARRNVIAVFQHSSGHRALRFIPFVDSLMRFQEHSNQGWTFAGQVLEPLAVENWHYMWSEPTHEYLTGAPDSTTPENVRAATCYLGMRDVLLHPEPDVDLDDHPQTLAVLRSTLASPQVQGRLREALDDKWRCLIMAIMGSDNEPLHMRVKLNQHLLLELDHPLMAEAAALSLVYAIGCQIPLQICSHLSSWPERKMADLVQESIFALVRETSVPIRRAACIMLSDAATASRRETREAAAYLLTRMVDVPEYREVASASLARLALAEAVSLSPLIKLESWQELNWQKLGEEYADRESMQEISRWLEGTGTSGEVAARANLRGEESKMKAMARILHSFNTSIRADGSVAQNRHYIVLEAGSLEPLRRKLTQAWLEYFSKRSLKVEDEEEKDKAKDAVRTVKVALINPGLYKEWFNENKDHDAKVNGMRPGSTGTATFVYGMRPSEVGPWVPMAVGADELFLELASKVAPADARSAEAYGGASRNDSAPVILRISASPVDGEPIDLGSSLVFDAQDGHWTHFLSPIFLRRLGLNSADLRALKVVREYYISQYGLVGQGVESHDSNDFSLEGSPWEASAEQAEGTPAQSAAAVSEADLKCRNLEELAERTASLFYLPYHARRLALHILLGLRSRTACELPKCSFEQNKNSVREGVTL